jgi:restriction system protein
MAKKRSVIEDLRSAVGSVFGKRGPRAERRWTNITRQMDTTRWNAELLRALEWKRFELLCAEYFRELGFRPEVTRSGPDAGVDIRLYPPGHRVAGIVVQCKSWRTPQVGVKAVRELFGAMAAEGVKEGILCACGTFTPDAATFATGRNIHLIDGTDLLAKLQDLEADTQASLLRFATRGDFTTPSCPSCGIKMVRKTPKGGGDVFWGCPNFPRCRTTLAAGK